jgi:hypothetical protein
MGIPETFRWEALAPGADPDTPLAGYFSNQKETLIRIRMEQPELGHWSLQALAMAWSRYSSDIHDTRWTKYVRRDIAFLGYIMLMSGEEEHKLTSSDRLACQASFQDWASSQAAIQRGKIHKAQP